jgi:hypothetical protein
MSNIDFLEECDKEENVEVTGGFFIASSLKRITQ